MKYLSPHQMHEFDILPPDGYNIFMKRPRKTRPLFWALFLVMLSYTPDAIPEQEIVIATNGSSPFTIVTPDNPAPQEYLAAKELSAYIEKISGAKLRITTESGARNPEIAVAIQGRLKHCPAAMAFTADDVAFDAFHIVSDRQNLYLIGSNKRAVLYAAYERLEKLGCRWPSFGINPDLDAYKKCEEYVPKKTFLTIGPLHERHKAAFKLRGFVGQPRFGNTPIQMIDWMAKNKMNYFLFSYPGEYDRADEWRQQVVIEGAVRRGFIIAVGHHSFSYFLDKETVAKEHPEYLALKNGVRSTQNRQICVSNPGAIETTAENIISYLTRHPEIDVFSFYPDDGLDWCECDLCRSSLKWSGNHKSQLATDSYQRFFNAVHSRVMKMFPEKVMDRLAYVHFGPVPVKEKMPLQTTLTYAVYWYRWWYRDPIIPGGYLGNVTEEIKHWADAVPGGVMIYEYYGGGASSHWQGFQLHHLMAKEISLYKSLGARGLITAGFWKYKDETALVNYTLARLLWDSKADPDRIVADFAEARFGPKAAPFMAQYYDEMEKNSRRYLKYFVHSSDDRERSYALCQEYLDKTKSLVGTEDQRFNLLHEQKVFDRYKMWQATK